VAKTATIKLDLDRTLGRLDPRIYGGFIEHLGRCVYGGIYDEGSPLSDARGFREDVLTYLRALKLPVLRWPGGNFASQYHWQDGVGPREARPRRMNLAWRAEESNHFGTAEFIAYCRALGAEPYLCVNMGSGTLDEAQAWVEYCNGTGDTHYANLRRAHGFPEPFGVRYWGLGNEMYGEWQIGATSAAGYVEKARQFARIMKETDPRVQLVGCGKFGWTDWDREVIEGIADVIEYYSIHLYTGSGDYYSNVLSPHQADRALRICQSLIDRVRYKRGIRHEVKVAYDEWNIWYRRPADDNQLEEVYDLADALAVATYLNVFIRNCRTIAIANLAQMVNVIAPIVTSPDGLHLQTIYHPLSLYSQHLRGTALDAFVACATHDLTPDAETSPWFHRVADQGPFKLLDAAATVDDARRTVALAVVNRDRDDAHTTTIALDGFTPARIESYEVNAAEVSAANTPEHPDTVGIVKRPVAAAGARFSYTFPAHSLTVLRMEGD
jgi:alpha-L-arabinofuranosidase